MAHVEDRWFRSVRDTGGATRKERTARHGAGLRWRARYEDPDGRERNRSFATKVMAEKFLTEVEHSKIAGSYRDPDAGRVTLRSYARSWLAGRTCDPATRQIYVGHVEHHILPGLGGERLDQLAARPTRVQAFVAGLGARGHRDRPLSASTARQVLGTLSRILAAAVDDGLISRNPCQAASVRAPKPAVRKVQPWTGDQVAAVRAGLPPRLRAIADAGAGLGLRQGEIFGLPVDEIDWLRQVVHVRLQVRLVGTRRVFAAPKGGRERDVPLPGTTGAALAEHVRLYPPREVTLPWRVPDGPPRKARLLFVSTDGNALLRPSFNNIWRSAVESAGLAPGQLTGSHQLRHRYASVLLHGGVDIRALSEYLGHHDPGFTLRVYSHLMPSAEGRARRAIEAALADADGPSTAQEVRTGP
jgi:integrase